MKTRLIKTALVAAVAGITLISTAAVAQADPIDAQAAVGKVTGKDGIGVFRASAKEPTSAHPLVLTTNDGVSQLVYCIDLHTELDGSHDYTEDDWNNSGVKQLEKIKWTLHNSLPNDTVDGILAKTGATLPGDYSAEEKESFVYAATQATVWHWSDDFNLATGNSSTADDTVDTAVTTIYNWLIANVEDMPDPGEPNLAFEGPDGETGKAGDKLGPFTVDTNLGTITLKVEGGKAVDEDGKEVTEVKGGDKFWLTSDKPGEVTVTGTGEVNIPTGRVFVSTQGKDTSQKLILAGALKKPGEAKLGVKFEIAASPSTPGPGLAVTGTSVTIMSIAGAALLGGGVVFAMMFMRRRRAAAATWGGEEDGMA